MEIDSNEVEDEYEFLSIDRYRAAKLDTKRVVVKQTLLNSPVITNIIANFKVQINKPFKGLSSVLFNDEEFQTLIPKEEDSQLDAFSDSDDDADELLFLGVSTNQSETSAEDKNPSVTPPSHIETIKVLVKYLSIVIDGIEFSTKSTIRSSCVIKASTPEGEDHLLIALKSGYLLLIRIYYVPRYYKDNDYSYQTQKTIPKDEGNSIYKPFIIQWWDTGSNNACPNLDSCGYLLRSSPSGFSTVASSSSNIFRLYMTQQNSNNTGTVLRNHINIPIDGFIIDACFLEPKAASIPTDVFFTLLFTESRRLTINLFSWSSSEGVWQGYNKDVLPLENTFEIPVFVVPLKANCSFLFVSPNKVTIISMHNIVSAHYDFQVIESHWQNSSFPTSYHVPTTNISGLEIDKMDEVLISTDNGVIYLITVIDNTFGSNCHPIVRVAESVSQFSMEKEDDKFRLIYTSDSGSASKDILIDELYSKEYLSDISYASKLAYSEARLLEDFKSWAPLIDVSVIDSNTHRKDGDIIPCRQEIWGISGLGKRSKLNQFRFGYYGTRKSNTYEKLRKSVGMWKLQFKGTSFLLCSLPFESILLEYQTNSKDAFVEVQESKLVTNSLTLFCTVISDFYILQVNQDLITVSDLFQHRITEFVPFRIVFVDVFEDLLVMVIEENGLLKIKVLRIAQKELSQEDYDISNYFELILEQELVAIQPSMLKVFSHNDCLITCLGSFEGFITFYSLKEGRLSKCTAYDLSEYSKYNHDSITVLDVVIPNEMIIIKDDIIIATKQGFIIKFKLGDTELICKYFLRLGYSQVKLIPTTDPNLIFAHCGKLWLFNNYTSEIYPNQVHFDDTFDRLLVEGVELPDSSSSKFKKLALIRDNGLVISQVSTFMRPSIKQFTKIENGKKLMYVPHISTFVVLCHGKNKIICVDKKSMKAVPQRETNLKPRTESEEYSIFRDDEVPQCVSIWKVQRNETSSNKRISKKLLVGCSKSPNSGVIKVLDFKKTKHETTNQPMITITELTSIDQDFPIATILQYKSLILFTHEETIYSTSYNEYEKRFTPIKQLKSLPSRIVNISESREKLLVSTSNDSIYQFVEENGELVFKSSDPISNSYINQVELRGGDEEEGVGDVAGTEDLVLVAGDKIHTNVSVFENFKFEKRLNLGVSGIPRVYLAKLNNPWVLEEKDGCVVCACTNGEILSLRMVSESSAELSNLKDRVGAEVPNLVQKMERPFVNKLSGTGLLSLNKPKFSCLINQNNEAIIDYDLDELSSHDAVINL
ncbi:hypothetical protein Cantr_09718 [Candida viswanathii]|uniref:Uncharacterized protein n=1 Tax=Candida viswanathii TaxID=5486 RepID=A0A367YBD7_9ASCO|nr:hypothetical protein Cantr_09718 [Candida viswanathii]